MKIVRDTRYIIGAKERWYWARPILERLIGFFYWMRPMETKVFHIYDDGELMPDEGTGGQVLVVNGLVIEYCEVHIPAIINTELMCIGNYIRLRRTDHEHFGLQSYYPQCEE